MNPHSSDSPVNPDVSHSEVNPVADLADEFLERYRRGETPRAEDYARQHPEFAAEIREVFSALQMVEGLKPRSSDQTMQAEAEEIDAFAAFPEIPDYEIIRETGRGGMGIVYEARQVSLDRRVALKLLAGNLTNNPTAVKRFQREARSAAALHHTNIVPVFDVGQGNGHHYYAMQFIDGQPLRDVIQEIKHHHSKLQGEQVGHDRSSPSVTPPFDHHQPKQVDTWPLAGAFDDTAKSGRFRRRSFFHSVAIVGFQVADALAYAHENGVIHRDIKPANLLVDSRRNVWVSDFGLAKTDEEDLTCTGDLIGTLRYMSPERFRRTGDASCDVYSLGATLYELAVLRPCFAQTDHLELIDAIANQVPIRPRSIVPSIPVDLETIILKAMDKNPKRRYATAAAMAEDLRRLIDGRPILARQVSAVERMWNWAVRNPAISSLLSLLLLATLVILVGSVTSAIVFRNITVAQLNLLEQRERDLYLAQMQQALEFAKLPTGIKQLRGLLADWKPKEGARDHRDWEWYWLNSVAERANLVLQSPHGGAMSVIWSPDQGHIAWSTGTSSQSVTYVADWPRFSTVRRLTGVGARVISARFSPDGSLLAVADFANVVQLWDWRQAKVVHQLEFDESLRAEALCWNPGGEWLAVQTSDQNARENGRLFVYQSSDWTRIASIANCNNDYLRQISLNPAGTLLAVADTSIENGSRGRIRLFDTATWKPVREKIAHSYAITCLDWHPEHNLIVSGGADKTIRIWNLDDDSLTTVDESEYQTAVRWIAGRNRLAFTGWNQGVSLWDVTSRTTDQMFGHEAKVYAMDWSPQHSVLVSACDDGQVRFWWDDSAVPVRTLRNEFNSVVVDPIGKICWSPDDTYFAAANTDPVSIWHVATSARSQNPRASKIWNAHLGKYEIVPAENYSMVGQAPSWSGQGSVFATGFPEYLDIWNAAGQHKVKRIELPSDDGGDKRKLGKFSPADDRNYFLIGMDQEQWWLESLDVNSEQRQRIMPRQQFDSPSQVPTELCCSPDGRFVAVGTMPGSFCVVDVAQKEIAKRFETSSEYATTAAWNHDGKYLAIGFSNHMIKLLDTTSWQVVKEFNGHSNVVRSLSWNANGTRLASGGDDRTLRIWDVASGQIAVYFSFDSEVRAVAFNHRGDALAAMSKNGQIRIYDAGLGIKRVQTPPIVKTIETAQGSIQIAQYDDF